MSGEAESLENTPTWSVAIVCSVFVIISLGLQQGLHYLGKSLKKQNRKSLYEALQKLKEVFHNPINHICISKSLTNLMLPCRKKEQEHSLQSSSEGSEDASHARNLFSLDLLQGHEGRLLSENAEVGHCELQGKVPLLSTEGMHQLHIFIFVLAIVHVVYCVLTMLLGSAKIHSWKRWEDEIKKNMETTECDQKILVTDVAHDAFVMSHANGPCMKSATFRWFESFWRQFYGSVKKSDYTTLRLGFIEAHCKANKKFDFHNYLVRSLEVDFKKVVGISGYLWAFVVIFLLLNIDGWHTYFWIAFLPFILLLIVGTKLQHVITRMAQEVIKKNSAVQGEIIVRLSDEYFWFGRPRLVLYLIHFILFQNAFELAFVLWILTNFGFDSCMMGKIGYMIPRVVIGVLVQVLCSYSTFPLYALVTQMGNSFKKSIFEEHIQKSISGWCEKAKMKSKARLSRKHSHGYDSELILKSFGSKKIEMQTLNQNAGSSKQLPDAMTITIDSLKT
eukprot:Gb_37259 [translate_table: standard]